MVKDSPYYIGDHPIFDPCDKCIVKVCCSEICKEKIMFLKGYKKPNEIVAKFKLLRRRKKK